MKIRQSMRRRQSKRWRLQTKRDLPQAASRPSIRQKRTIMENFKAMGNMKRLETLCIAGAVAVLAVSCGKEGAVREDRASEVEFTASELQVKTVFGEKADGKYPVLWTSNEKLHCSIILKLEVRLEEDSMLMCCHPPTGIPPDSPHHSLTTETEATVSMQ